MKMEQRSRILRAVVLLVAGWIALGGNPWSNHMYAQPGPQEPIAAGPKF
jgi:hypothetical protein